MRIGKSGDDNYLQVRKFRFLLNFSANFHAVHIRHLDIQNKQIRPESSQLDAGFRSAGGFLDQTFVFFLKELCQHFPDPILIVDNQNLEHCFFLGNGQRDRKSRALTGFTGDIDVTMVLFYNGS